MKYDHEIALIVLALVVFACTPLPESAPAQVPAPAVPPTPVAAPTTAPPVAAPSTPAAAPVPSTQAAVSPKLIYPTLTYPGAYNGPLYETSFQAGDTGPMDLHFQNMDRNGVSFTIGFFGVEFAPPQSYQLLTTYELGYAVAAVKAHPGRIVPFYSQLLDPDETNVYTLAQDLDAIFTASDAIVPGFLQGIGEMPIMDLPMKADDKNMRALADVARKHDLILMFHPIDGQVANVKTLIEAYPDIKFFIHMYAEDASSDAKAYGDLMKAHDNLYFSIDADHMMFLETTGLLYKYEEMSDTKQAAKFFVADYGPNEARMLASALARYRPLIEAAPDRVMWGTEMGPAYNYEPEVYDAAIKFTRKFIGQLKPEYQEKLAYKNALAYFGPGITYTKPVTLVDSSSWPYCTDAQVASCDPECDDLKVSDVEACSFSCLSKLKCFEEIED